MAPEQTVTGCRAGEEMPAKAKQIDGYRLIGDEFITITLQAGDSNFITFYYEEIPEEGPTTPPVTDPETPG